MKKLQFEFTFGANAPYDEQDEWQRRSNGYRVCFTYSRRQTCFDFWQGSGITHDPKANDVMSCLVSDANAGMATFDDFCNEFGYDTDSRKAEQTWQACQRIGKQLSHLFGADYTEAMEHGWERES